MTSKIGFPATSAVVAGVRLPAGNAPNAAMRRAISTRCTGASVLTAGKCKRNAKNAERRRIIASAKRNERFFPESFVCREEDTRRQFFDL